MGGAPNYAKGRAAMRRMSEGKAKAFAQNVIIEHGKGRYPKCLELLPYEWCPKPEEVPKDPKEIPKTCKTCQEYIKSNFQAEERQRERLKRLQEAGIPLSVTTPTNI